MAPKSSSVFIPLVKKKNVAEKLQCNFSATFIFYKGDNFIAESLEECVRRLLTSEEAIEKKGLRVNAGKTKIMICGKGLNLLQSSGEFPSAVCRTGVGSNRFFCNGCKHKKCSGLKHLTKYPEYRCTWCQGTAHPLDGRPQRDLFVLRFYGPVNPMVSCQARSVYLTTRLLGRLSPLSG